MSEKTHQPTAQKLREARKKGQIPRSRLFTSASVTLGGLTATLAFGPETAVRLRGWTVSLVGLSVQNPIDALWESARVLALCVTPTLVGALVGAVASAVATAGLQVNADAVTPKLERLNPAEGFKKLFSLRQLVDVLKGLLVAAIIGWFMWSAVRDAAPWALRGVSHDGAGGLLALLALLRPAVLKAAAVLLVLGVGDWALARRRHIKDLMMSHEEVKQEHKNSEGDPHHKAKRKAEHKKLASGGPARGVHKATAVVVNPTHIAVALRYDEAECDAPYIVAKAREEDALKLRKEAASQGIPVIKDVPLARSLIHYDVGEEVPEELYQAAAAVLKVALEQSESRDAQPEGETP
ncbi:MAG: EscU/YscU/HrcU family type III secretion system export apparatus switch protein [Myxococcota bacterium]